jgi:Cu2+-containing amine oxidase
MLAPWLCAADPQNKPDFTQALKVAKISAPLSGEESTVAVRLAVEALKSKNLFSDKKMYLTEARIIRDTAAEIKGVFERVAVLTYYRYEGDLPIEVFINLARKEVLAVKPQPKLVPPLSREEFDLAREMALNNPEIQAALGRDRDRLVVEPITARSESPKDPLFRHRYVYLMFRVGPKYVLLNSSVLVDLTTEKVIIEPVAKKAPM